MAINDFHHNKALFLDRDGVINVDYGHVHKLDTFHYIDGIFDLCRCAQKNGYVIIVVTNQAGIGRGLYSEEDFRILTNIMIERFKSEAVEIKDVFFCPYHSEAGLGKYKVESYDRKPNPGMLIKAAEKYQIDLNNSVMIGDKESDMEAAVAANVGFKIHFGVGKSEISDFSVANHQQALEVLECIAHALF